MEADSDRNDYTVFFMDCTWSTQYIFVLLFGYKFPYGTFPLVLVTLKFQVLNEEDTFQFSFSLVRLVCAVPVSLSNKAHSKTRTLCITP